MYRSQLRPFDSQPRLPKRAQTISFYLLPPVHAAAVQESNRAGTTPVSSLSVRLNNRLSLTGAVAQHHGSSGSTPMELYLADPNDSRLPSRLAQQSILKGRTSYGGARPGVGTSMIQSGHSSLAALTHASSAASPSSAPSAMGARATGTGRVLSHDPHGALQVPPHNPTVILECPFQFNGCILTFISFRQWFDHSLTHFGSCGPSPRNKCCFCDRTFNAVDGMTSWTKRMTEIAQHHAYGCRLAHARPDFDLFKYLWGKRLIDDAHYKDLMGAKRLPVHSTPPTSSQRPTTSISSDVFTVNNDNRRRNRGGHPGR